MRVSIGTAAALGLSVQNIDVIPTTAYLMVGTQCLNRCSFCSQEKDKEKLSRIPWPEFDDDIVIRALNQSMIERVCFQCTSTNLETISMLALRIDKKISISYDFQDIEEVRNASRVAEMVCIPLDVSNPKLFKDYKHSDYQSRLNLIIKASKELPNRITTHIIVGLGESEKELRDLIEFLVLSGVTVALFANTPGIGEKPELKYYRRVQSFLQKVKKKSLDKSAFMTTGCDACNRPFYNETPGGPWYNYPRMLTDEEYDKCKKLATDR